jgi:hypothetical protein
MVLDAPFGTWLANRKAFGRHTLWSDHRRSRYLGLGLSPCRTFLIDLGLAWTTRPSFDPNHHRYLPPGLKQMLFAAYFYIASYTDNAIAEIEVFC